VTGITVSLVDWSDHARVLTMIRDQVFIVEQDVPLELERDPDDLHYIHALARDSSGRGIATGRLLPDGKIGRMAVLSDWRGSGVGRKLLDCLIGAAAARGDGEVHLDAQIHASEFYRRYGFTAEGEPFMDAGIPHIHMVKTL